MSSSQSQSSPDPEQGNQANGIQQGQSLQQQQQHQQQQEQNQAIQQQSQLQQQLQQQNLQQVLQHQQNQSLQQSLQQEQQSQQQTLQQMLQHQQQQQQQVLQQRLSLQVNQALQQQHSMQQQQQQQQQHQALQQSLQQTLQVSQAQAQAIQAQAELQQQVAQSLQQQSLHDHIQAVQQHQIQAALQRKSATLQELQQQAQQQALLAQQAGSKPARSPRARPFNKPRGRMTAYAFFVQTCREEHKKKHPDENVIFAAFSKKCAERWNTMSEKEKARFHEMAEHDKRRFDLEMQSYVPPKDARVGRARKRHQLKDPNAPKRSISAFFWFCSHERAKVKAANPEYTMGDIAKELGRLWAAADPATKAKFEQLSEQDKARYDRQMTEYKKGLVPAPPAPGADADARDFDGDEEFK